jgi:hypothetical protein
MMQGEEMKRIETLRDCDTDIYISTEIRTYEWLQNGDVLFPVRYEQNLYMLCRRK